MNRYAITFTLRGPSYMFEAAKVYIGADTLPDAVRIASEDVAPDLVIVAVTATQVNL